MFWTSSVSRGGGLKRLSTLVFVNNFQSLRIRFFQFFSKHANGAKMVKFIQKSQNCPAAAEGFAHRPPYLAHVVAPVCSSRYLNFQREKFNFGFKLSPPLAKSWSRAWNYINWLFPIEYFQLICDKLNHIKALKKVLDILGELTGLSQTLSWTYSARVCIGKHKPVNPLITKLTFSLTR